MTGRRAWEVFMLFALLALWPACGAIAANCGPTYGADGIAVDGKGDIWLTHFEDARIGKLSPADGKFREYLASSKANSVVATQAGRVDKGEFDYSRDNGFSGIALDEKNGFLWTVRFGTNRLVRFSLKDASVREFKFRAQLFYTRGPLPMAEDGSLWLLTATPSADGLDGGALVKFSAKGEIAGEFALPDGAFASPVVAADGQGRPWVALTPARGSSAKLYMLEDGKWLARPVSDAGRFITGMTFDPQGRLWLALPEKNAVARYDAGRMNLYPVPTANAFPQQVFAGPQNGIWFTEWNGHRIGRLSESGGFREYALPAEEESPLTLAFAKDGKVWFSALFNYGLFRLDTQTGSIDEFAIPPPSNWFGDAAGVFSSCSISPRGAATVDAAPLKPLRHPRGHEGNEAAALFERSCNTQCHSWYRVDKAAQRRSDWTATVDRMISRNGARFISDAKRAQIIRYLNENYAARNPGQVR